MTNHAENKSAKGIAGGAKAKPEARKRAQVKKRPKAKKRGLKAKDKPIEKTVSAVKSKTSKRGQPSAKRVSIVRAASKLLSDMGYHETSLKAVAKQLDMTNGALYYYFTGKEDLAFECLKATYNLVGENLTRAENLDVSGLRKVENFVKNTLVDIREQEFWAMPGEPSFLEEIHRDELKQDLQDNVNRLASLLRSGVKDGSIGWCEPEATAILIFGSLIFMQSWKLPFGSALSVIDLGGVTVDFVMRSLSNLLPSSRGAGENESMGKPA